MGSVWIRYRGVRLPVRRRTLIGRSPYATLIVDAPMVSREHAVVEPRVDGVEVRDVGSTNGTRVNGETLVGSRRLQHGDVIEIGKELLQIELGEHRSSQWLTPSAEELASLLESASRRPVGPGDEKDTERELMAATPTLPANAAPLPPTPPTIEPKGTPGKA
jgi:pSer/pThr/pTyr-binding forkhead associated (FHA) protein